LLDKIIVIQQFISYCERNDKLQKLCEILTVIRPEKVKQYPCFNSTTTYDTSRKEENIGSLNLHTTIKQLLTQNHTVQQALQLLREKLPNENSIIMFFSDYNQITSDIIKGLTTYNSVEWHSLVNRVLNFVDGVENELK